MKTILIDCGGDSTCDSGTGWNNGGGGKTGTDYYSNINSWSGDGWGDGFGDGGGSREGRDGDGKGCGGEDDTSPGTGGRR